MASFNNKHWPSMFRSKHAAGHPPWQPQADMSGSPNSLVSGGSTTTTRSSLKHSFPGGEERVPDPKPRWNPRPEQIRILEAIFNSGMVNPPRDEIPRIRARLQEYAPVSDANVFYWFQNRKARSKNKLRAAPARAPPPARHHAAALITPPQQIQQTHQQVQLLAASPVQRQAPTSSSSSSSDRSSGSSRPAAKPAAAQTISATEAVDLLGPLAAACPQAYYQGQPVAPAPAAPSPKAQLKDDHRVAADESNFFPWPEGHCLSAAELAAILGTQYMHVPAVQPQPPALPAVPFVGICNEVAAPTTTINRHPNCASWASGLGLYWPSGSADDHHQACKNTAAVEVASHEGAEKPRLLLNDFGVSTAMDAAAAAVAVTLPLSASPDAAVAVASSTTGLAAGSAATTAANAVVTNYDQLFQGLVDGVAAGATGEPAAAAGVAVLCIGDSATGRSVVREVAARHLDVRAQFGQTAVLFRYASDDGERPVHVPVDAASGCTVEPLQHGVVYWVLV